LLLFVRPKICDSQLLKKLLILALKTNSFAGYRSEMNGMGHIDQLQQHKDRSGKQYNTNTNNNNNNNNPHNNANNSNNTKYQRNISRISQDNQICRNDSQQQNLDGVAPTSSSFSASSSTILSAASLAKINGVALPCAKCSMKKADNHILKSTTGPVAGSNTIPPRTQKTSVEAASYKVFQPMNK